ncbi:MAG: hypothetical protein ACQ9MH_19295 [Nitrospinales bacterium]
MRSRITLIFVAVVVIFTSGCCLRFTDQAPSATYNVGDVITTSRTNIAVEKFQWGNGNWTTSGKARIDTRNYSKGSGNDLNAENVNLRFLFDYPVGKITFKFGELGGNNNIRVNNEFRNVQNLVSLNGTTIGSAQVTVNAIQQGNNWHGMMTIDGNINNFSIGGQELYLDDICTRE